MSGADKSDCASWCALPADHEGTCVPGVAMGSKISPWAPPRTIAGVKVPSEGTMMSDVTWDKLIRQHADLLEAVRVRPSARAIKLLRAHQEAMEAMACDEEENIEAIALDTLLQLADKITAVLKRHTEGG